jgi:hypothetical protein
MVASGMRWFPRTITVSTRTAPGALCCAESGAALMYATPIAVSMTHPANFLFM